MLLNFSEINDSNLWSVDNSGICLSGLAWRITDSIHEVLIWVSATWYHANDFDYIVKINVFSYISVSHRVCEDAEKNKGDSNN